MHRRAIVMPGLQEAEFDLGDDLWYNTGAIRMYRKSEEPGTGTGLQQLWASTDGRQEWRLLPMYSEELGRYTR